MARRFLALAPVLALIAGCAHRPETVVHLSAPGGGAWTVHDRTGASICVLPCRVELDEDEAVTVVRPGAEPFVVQQQSLGRGTWNGFVRVHEEPGAGARAVQALSGMLLHAGGTMLEDRRERVGGVVLAGLGTVGLLAASALPSKKREELWLERTGAP
jgi:hypothetical protein